MSQALLTHPLALLTLPSPALPPRLDAIEERMGLVAQEYGAHLEQAWVTRVSAAREVGARATSPMGSSMECSS